MQRRLIHCFLFVFAILVLGDLASCSFEDYPVVKRFECHDGYIVEILNKEDWDCYDRYYTRLKKDEKILYDTYSLHLNAKVNYRRFEAMDKNGYIFLIDSNYPNEVIIVWNPANNVKWPPQEGGFSKCEEGAQILSEYNELYGDNLKLMCS